MFGRSAGTNPWPPSTSRHSAGGEGEKKMIQQRVPLSCRENTGGDLKHLEFLIQVPIKLPKHRDEHTKTNPVWQLDH